MRLDPIGRLADLYQPPSREDGKPDQGPLAVVALVAAAALLALAS